MTVSYRTGIIILQFICFVPIFFASVWLCFYQGWRNAASSWRYIITLAMLRMASDIAYFINLTDPSNNALAAVVVCDLIGLAPLMLTCMGFLSRVNRIPRTFPTWFFVFVDLFALAGLILGIVGAVILVGSPNVATADRLIAIFYTAVAVFLAIYVILISTVVTLYIKKQQYDYGRERHILTAVAVCTGILLIRLLFAVLSDYTEILDFQLVIGNDTVYLVMSVLPEIFVAVICLVVGSLIPPPREPVRQDIRDREDDGREGMHTPDEMSQKGLVQKMRSSKYTPYTIRLIIGKGRR